MSSRDSSLALTGTDAATRFRPELDFMNDSNKSKDQLIQELEQIRGKWLSMKEVKSEGRC